jgi:hypothetical protein
VRVGYFSLTDLRDQLERFYVLCPPPIWQRLVLSHLASLGVFFEERSRDEVGNEAGRVGDDVS